MDRPLPEEVGGYVLAGGKSTRMGRDKALLRLAGEPLVRHAVKKLRRVCMDVRILSNNPELAAYAPILPDLHPGCGPMAGIEAALAHSVFEWNLFLPVDMPFLPTAYLRHWVNHALLARGSHPTLPEGHELPGAHALVWMFTVDGIPQPALTLVHREVRPFLKESLERGEYKLLPAFEKACREISVGKGLSPGVGMAKIPYWSKFTAKPGPQRKCAEWCYTTEAQEAAKHLWFANLNTPAEFAKAEKHLNALDT